MNNLKIDFKNAAFRTIFNRTESFRENLLKEEIMKKFIDILEDEKYESSIKKISDSGILGAMNDFIIKKSYQGNFLISYAMVEKLVVWFLLSDNEEDNKTLFTVYSKFCHSDSYNKESFEELFRKFKELVALFIYNYFIGVSPSLLKDEDIVYSSDAYLFISKIAKEPIIDDNDAKEIVKEFTTIPSYDDERKTKRLIFVNMMKLSILSSIAISGFFTDEINARFNLTDNYNKELPDSDRIRYNAVRLLKTINDIHLFYRSEYKKYTAISGFRSIQEYISAANTIRLNDGTEIDPFVINTIAPITKEKKEKPKTKVVEEKIKVESDEKILKMVNEESNDDSIYDKLRANADDINVKEYVEFIKEYILPAYNAILKKHMSPCPFGMCVNKKFKSVDADSALYDIYVLNHEKEFIDIDSSVIDDKYLEFLDFIKDYPKIHADDEEPQKEASSNNSNLKEIMPGVKVDTSYKYPEITDPKEYDNELGDPKNKEYHREESISYDTNTEDSITDQYNNVMKEEKESINDDDIKQTVENLFEKPSVEEVVKSKCPHRDNVTGKLAIDPFTDENGNPAFRCSICGSVFHYSDPLKQAVDRMHDVYETVKANMPIASDNMKNGSITDFINKQVPNMNKSFTDIYDPSKGIGDFPPFGDPETKHSWESYSIPSTEVEAKPEEVKEEIGFADFVVISLFNNDKKLFYKFIREYAKTLK